MGTPARVLLGIIGYCPFVRSYPLGPELLERVQAPPWPAQRVLLRDLNWGPIAIVQEWQASPLRVQRAVLVGATDRGYPPNAVSCRRWLGGPLEARRLQERVFEAVTGVVSLDNLLLIGEHFRVWPAEVLTVEVQLAPADVGAFVLAELGQHGSVDPQAVVGERPLRPELLPTVQRMAALVRRAVIDGAGALDDLQPLGPWHLPPPASFCSTSAVPKVARA